MELMGREIELRVVGEHVEKVAAGRGGMLVVEGPAGCGKTSLVAQAKALVRRAGVRSCVAEASPAEWRTPFAPLLAALDGNGPAGIDREFVVLGDIERALRELARTGPVALILDDLQHADAETLLALTTLPARMGDLPILWVLAAGPGRPIVRDLLALLIQRGARRLDLGPLDDHATAQLIAAVLHAEPGPRLLELAAAAGGDLSLLVELLEGLRHERRVRVADGVATVTGEGLPQPLVQATCDRLDGLSEDARRAICLAVSEPATQGRGVDEALRAGLLVEDDDGVGFRCELLRQAVMEAMPDSFRLELVAA
jgi:AAA ATPase-like protein